MKLHCLIAFVCLFFGCALGPPTATDTMDVSLEGVRYHRDAEVMLSEVAQAVTPVSMPDESLRALVVPFAVRQDVGVRHEIGREMADIFHRAWLTERVFDVLEYDSAKPWPGLKDAMALARSKGANVLVAGNLSQYLEGGGIGKTSIGLTIQVYWIPTETLIWSAAQAGLMEGAPNRDYVVVRTTTRLPEFPTYAVMQALSRNLATVFISHFRQ